MQETNIIVKGVCSINGCQIKNIEGGFGENQKCISVKDVAQIHDQTYKEINRRINDNIERFKKGKDIIDIKPGGYEPLGQEMGYSKQSFNQTNNIYILSERGYFKLIKLMNNDKAWDIYEELLDNYFSMRTEIKEQKKFYEKKIHYTKEGSLLLIDNNPEGYSTYENLINNVVLNELNRIIELTGMKVTFIGQKCNITDSRLSRWRMRSINITEEELKKITEILDKAKYLLE